MPTADLNTCLAPGIDCFPSDNFIVGSPAYSTSLYTVSNDGASADTPILVPTPNALIGAPSSSSRSTSNSSSPPLTMMVASCRPAASSFSRVRRDSSRRSPLSMRTASLSLRPSASATSIAVSTPVMVSYVSTRNAVRSGKSVAIAMNASRSVGNASTYEWAMVPTAGTPSRRAASTLLVPANPAMAAARAAAIDASIPCVRRSEKSTNEARPRAASEHRVAFVASTVWKVIWLSRIDSTSCASGSGAVTSSSGSFGSTTRPSGIAQTSPVNRSAANASTAAASNP